MTPIARQLALQSLKRQERRTAQAHRLAAEFYKKRLPRKDRGSSVQDTRELSRYGTAFVEARYHLLQTGRDAEFQDMASDYRSALLRSYRDVRDVPTSPTAQQELLATLGAALHDVDAGYPRLRSVLAQLLATRRRIGDAQACLSAYQHRDARIDPH